MVNTIKKFNYFISWKWAEVSIVNILLLSQFFSSTKGGGEYLFCLIAKVLAENHHKVWVITNRISNEQYMEHENIKLIFVKPTLEYKGGLPPAFSDNLRYVINAIKEGLKIIKKEKIDLIHSNNYSPVLAGSILSSFTSKPHVTTVHDVVSLCGKDYWKLWGKQNKVSKINVFVGPLFEKLMIKFRYKCIHTVSEATRDDLLLFGAKKPIYVIPNSIDIHHIPTLEVNPFQFIYVGRLVFYKNLEIVIKAINIVSKVEPKVKLIIVGGGPYKKILEELTKKMRLQSNIEFRGYVSTQEKERLIASSCALVFPSLCEGFGISILEAFAQEKPVLVSDIRPMTDIVTHEKTGFLINPHDEHLWSQFILKIIKNQKQSSIMGKNGSQLLTTTYNQNSLYQKILKMYSDVL